VNLAPEYLNYMCKKWSSTRDFKYSAALYAGIHPTHRWCRYHRDRQ